MASHRRRDARSASSASPGCHAVRPGRCRRPTVLANKVRRSSRRRYPSEFHRAQPAWLSHKIQGCAPEHPPLVRPASSSRTRPPLWLGAVPREHSRRRWVAHGSASHRHSTTAMSFKPRLRRLRRHARRAQPSRMPGLEFSCVPHRQSALSVMFLRPKASAFWATHSGPLPAPRRLRRHRPVLRRRLRCRELFSCRRHRHPP